MDFTNNILTGVVCACGGGGVTGNCQDTMLVDKYNYWLF